MMPQSRTTSRGATSRSNDPCAVVAPFSVRHDDGLGQRAHVCAGRTAGGTHSKSARSSTC